MIQLAKIWEKIRHYAQENDSPNRVGLNLNYSGSHAGCNTGFMVYLARKESMLKLKYGN